MLFVNNILYNAYCIICYAYCFFQITKKLSGPVKGTAQWLTSVGNEIGQVLISVLTANEGAGLDLMAAGLMERYQRAGLDPPTVIYVDCDCYKEVGETKLKRQFSGTEPELDRAAAAVAGGGSTLRTYTGELVYSVNENYNKLYGRKLVPSFTPPTVYTGKDILINAVHDVACFC